MKLYILSDIQQRLGHINGTQIWEITWVDPEDLAVLTTTVDESYRNYRRNHWDVMVSGAIPYGLYQGLVKTLRQDRDRLSVLSADSYPQLIEPMTAREVEQFIEIRQQDLAPTQFADVFTIE